MNQLEQAARQALEVLDGMEQNHGNLWQVNASPEGLDALCVALRAALEHESHVTVRYDLSAAQTEGAIREKLIALGWTPPEAPAAVAQKPVGFMNAGHVYELEQKRRPYGYVYAEEETGADVALYTAPQPRQPLTREHVRGAGGAVHSDGSVFFSSLDHLNRAIEAASGNQGEVA